MAEQKFKIGDEVQHKSGGPKMVIKGYEPIDSIQVVCEWMNRDDMPVEKAFHQDVLITYEPPPLISYIQL